MDDIAVFKFLMNLPIPVTLDITETGADFSMSDTPLSRVNNDICGMEPPVSPVIPTSAPTTSVECSEGEVLVKVIRQASAWAYEESFALYSGLTTEGTPLLEYTSSSSDIVTFSLCVVPGIFSVKLMDSENDGWTSGSYLRFEINDENVGELTLAEFNDKVYTIVLAPGSSIIHTLLPTLIHTLLHTVAPTVAPTVDHN